jgi:drug/metabolite transporter (DMT)-like permease
VATFILKRDNLKLGLVLGLLGPVLGLVFVYLFSSNFRSLSFGEFLDYFFNTRGLITSVGALCLLANAVLFTLYINTHRDKTAKGIFATTLVYGIAILIIKVFI